MRQATEKQIEILEYVVGYVEDNRRQPTLDEVGEAFGITGEAVRCHLLALEKKQLIEYSGRGPRNIHITDEALELIEGR